MALPLKQRLFVSYYLGISAGNATDAARRAGFKSPRMAGSRLMTFDDIRSAIEVKLNEVAMSQDEVLMRVSDIARSSLEDFINVTVTGTFQVNLKKARARGKLHTLKKIKDSEDGPEIEVKDSFPALVKLGGYHGIWDREPAPEINMEAVAERNKRKRAERKKSS